MDDALLQRLEGAARGGRVEHSGFLDPVPSSRLASELRRRGVSASVGGGYPGAQRRVVVAHPEQIPTPLPPFIALYFAGVSEADLDAILGGRRVEAGRLGDRIAHRDGVSQIALDPPPPELLGAPLGAEVVPVGRAAAGSVRELQLIVPAARADALGAKAFRVSRSYFARGISAGNVYRNGDRVAKGGALEAGDELFADGLGWMRLLSVEGETRRGNLRVLVEVERSG